MELSDGGLRGGGGGDERNNNNNPHHSFLNRLLMLREQEIRILSKKLHQQVALDSDGGSGVSEGSLGSPEAHNMSMSPLRPDTHTSHTTPTYNNNNSNNNNNYNNNNNTSNVHTSYHDTNYEQKPTGEHTTTRGYDNSRYAPLVESFNHNHLYNRGQEDDRQRSVYWDRSNQEAHQQSGEGTAREEDGDIAARMTESLLEQHRKRQQTALATQALLGSLATPPTPHYPLLPYSNQQQDDPLPDAMDDTVGGIMGASSLLVRALASSVPRRPRGEKKPIPETLKDDKYYERRRRNNLAAKKSRDARKQREDQIAIRASYLEKENSVLRAQVATLRDEATSLRHLLLQKKKN